MEIEGRVEIDWQQELRDHAIREIAMVSLASQGAISAGQVLTSLAVDQGKHVYQGLNVRGGKSNVPVISSIRIADSSLIPSCGVGFPTEMIVFDESLYSSLDQEPKALKAMRGLRSGYLIVSTWKQPDQVEFPFDFEGTVATVDARRISFEVMNLNPPPFGTTLLGLHAAATGAWDADTLDEAVRRRFPGKVGEVSARAARLAYENAQVKEGVRIQGTRDRNGFGADLSLEQAPEFLSLEATPLPGISNGNTFIWRELLPVWNRDKCRCATQCPLVDSCPEGVISYRQRPLSYSIDYEYCKGCGICAHECLGHAITMRNAVEVYGR